MLQDPVKPLIPVANFDSALVKGQPSVSHRSQQMLSLYTNFMIRLRSEEKGATAVEYGIMVALIAVVIIVAVSLLGNNLLGLFNNVAGKVTVPTVAPTTPAG
ncbi:Flp family type IVb pilin [Pseudarthrobacter enclensis]|uniref:Flp family type IVb pilin n=1 Tax=Pseudarthrobacter enclensis TaxID=993070 RepID=UPI00342A0EAB